MSAAGLVWGEQLRRGHSRLQVGQAGIISVGCLELGIGMGTGRRLLIDVMAIDRRSELARRLVGTGAGAFTLGRSVVVVVAVLGGRMPLLPLVMMMSSTSAATTSTTVPAAASAPTASNRQQTVGSESDRWTTPVVELTLTGAVVLRRRRLKQGIVVYVRDVRQRAQARLTPRTPQTVHTVFGPLLLQVLQRRLERSDHSQLQTTITRQVGFDRVAKSDIKNTKEINTMAIIIVTLELWGSRRRKDQGDFSSFLWRFHPCHFDTIIITLWATHNTHTINNHQAYQSIGRVLLNVLLEIKLAQKNDSDTEGSQLCECCFYIIWKLYIQLGARLLVTTRHHIQNAEKINH